MTNYVVCLKHGDKYSAEYVNVLHNMVSRNLTIPFNFAVFTENAHGIKPGIEIYPLPAIPDVQGWWYKPMFFNPGLPVKGTILYIDLDVIIFKNIIDLPRKSRNFEFLHNFQLELNLYSNIKFNKNVKKMLLFYH